MEFNIEASATSNKKLIETYPCLNNFCYTEKEIKRPRIELIKDENEKKCGKILVTGMISFRKSR